MTIKIYLSHIEIRNLTESQRDYLAVFDSFGDIFEVDGIFRIYGNRSQLYTALLLIAQRYSIEILQ